MTKHMEIDYNGKKLKVDLETMKVINDSIPETFEPNSQDLNVLKDHESAALNMVWMTKNLDINDGEGGITRNPDHPEYGCYYTWEAAKRIADKIPGWHLPTVQEWDMLAVIVGGINVAGKNLKSKNCWDPDAAGTDFAGFAAIPAGYYADTFTGVGSNAYFWTATAFNRKCAFYRYFCTDTSMHSYVTYKDRRYSVRLVKDA